MKKFCIALICWSTAAAATSRAAAPAVASLGSYTQSLQAPARVATDAAGNVYASDPQTGNVVVFDLFGRVRSTHGGFAGPLGVAVDAQGRIYVAEEQAGRVSVFNAAWGLLYKLGGGDREFVQPNHIAIDATNGNVYVTDSAANAVKVYAGGTLSNRFGSAGTGDSQFSFPAGICVSAAGEVFVVDQGNDRVEVFNRSGTFLRKFALKTGGMGTAPSGRAQAAFIDGLGRLYVADAFQGCVKVFDAAAGTYLGRVGAYGEGAGQLLSPVGVALDPYNRLIVASSNTGRIELFGLDSYLHFAMVHSGGAVGVGAKVVFTVTAGGSEPFGFQWQKDGANLDGETGSTLTIASAGLGSSGSYSVAVTGPSGPVTSSATLLTVLEPPTITTVSPLAGGTRGVAYSQSFAASSGATPYAWSVSAGALPDGLTFSSAGLLSGVPMAGGAFDFTAQVSDANGLTATQAISVIIQTTPFDDWRVSKFAVTELVDEAISGEGADPDGDGLCNLLEYALNRDPKNAEAPAPPPLALTGAVSRKSHGGAGVFDLSVVPDPTASPTVEPRLGGPTELVFSFNQDIAAADGAISDNEFSLSNATFSAASISGSTLTLNLDDISDQSLVTVVLQGIVALDGSPLAGANAVRIRALYGDIDQSGSVNLFDLQAVKNKLLQKPTAANFLSDVDVNGSVNLFDLQAAKNNLLHSVSLPAAPVSGGSVSTPSSTTASVASSLPAATVAALLGIAVDAPELVWTTNGDELWLPAVTPDGQSAAWSGKIGDLNVSWIETSVVGPGSMSFEWKVSSERDGDFLTLSVDGVDQTGHISGEVDWQPLTFNVPAGTHVVRWTYAKNRSVSVGGDIGWLRKVKYLQP